MHLSFSLFSKFSGSLLFLIFFLAVGTPVRAQLYWSGTGAWDTTSQNWGTVDGGPYDEAIWSNATPDSAIFQGTAGTVTLGEAITAGGLTFSTDGYLVTGNTLTLSGTPSITAGNGVSATIGSDLVGTANVLVGGPGAITLTGASAYTGQTMVRNGQFEIGNGASLSGTSRINTLDDGELIVSGTVTVGDNGQFAVGMGEASAGTVTVASGGTLNIGNGSGGTVGFAGLGGRFLSSGSAGHGTLNIDGTVNLAAGGTGAAGLDGNRFWLNPYLRGGSATINLNSGGVLNAARPISHGGGGGPGSSNFYFDGGILRAAGNIILLQTQTDPIIGHIKAGGALIDTDGFNATIQSPMRDDGAPGNFTKQGAGSLTLSGASSFTGDITISAGELVTNLQRNLANPATSALGNLTVEGRTVTVESGATLTFGNVNDSLGSFQYKTPVTMVADGGTIQNGSGRFLSIGDIVLRNGGVLNTQNGAAEGFQTFNLRGSITVGGTSGALITTTGTLRTGIHLGGTTIAPTTFDVAATGNPTADLIVSVPLLDEVNATTGGLIKAGDGRMVLAAANTYSGDTVISEGTLALGSSGSISNSSVVLNGGAFNVSALAGGYTIESGTSLSGTGSVAGNLTVDGLLAIGSSPGTMNFGGDLGLNGVAEFEITDPALSMGSYDLATGTGSVEFGGILNLFFSGGSYADGATVQIFDFDGGYSGDFAAINFTGLAAGQSASFNSSTGFVTVIPEPSAALVGGLGILLLLRRRRN